jgi:NAD-dependent SIR2 family protein deacetylase
MAEPPELSHNPKLPKQIIAAADGNLVLFVGAGISKLCGLPTWAELADQVLDWLIRQQAIDFWEKEQLRALEPRTKLSIAAILCEEKKIPFELKPFLDLQESQSDIYDVLNGMGCPCVTTNYDELLKPIPPPPNGDISNEATPIVTHRVFKADEIDSGLLDNPGTVIHLHGSMEDRTSIIATMGQYLTHYDQKNIQGFLESLFKKTVLFLGYSLAEAEILEYIFRRAKLKKGDEGKRFLLQGFFQRHDSLYRNSHSYYQKSFGVEVVGYALDKKGYAQQEEILKSWAEQIQVKPTTLADDLTFMDEVLRDD